MNCEIDIGSTTLRTARLTLRPWRAEDLEDLFEYARVDGVGQMAGWQPHESVDTSRQILDMFIRERRTFCLEYRGKAVGSLGLERYDEERFAELDALRGREIGYVLSKDCWGRGLMTEAVKAVIRWLFGEIGLDFILVGHFEHNARSARVIEKCGFRYVRTIPYQTQAGITESSRTYILYGNEWKADDVQETIHGKTVETGGPFDET